MGSPWASFPTFHGRFEIVRRLQGCTYRQHQLPWSAGSVNVIEERVNCGSDTEQTDHEQTAFWSKLGNERSRTKTCCAQRGLRATPIFD